MDFYGRIIQYDPQQPSCTLLNLATNREVTIPLGDTVLPPNLVKDRIPVSVRIEAGVLTKFLIGKA